ERQVLASGRDHNVAVRAFVRPPDPALLAANADIGIGAAGMSNWERCCLGLPSIIIDVVDNQILVAQATENAGAAIWLRRGDADKAERWHDAIEQLCSADRFTRIAGSALGLCDGRGAARILAHIDPPTDSTGAPVSLRPAAPSD